jgi:uncharacterized membrane protein
MAQQGFLTPLVRLIASTLLGAALLGFSEVVRRTRRDEAGPMTAALTAGAGAATLYAVIWAAHGLYGYVGAEVTAALLAGVAGLLLALSLLHGRALALLAVGAAYAVPIVTGGPASATWAGWSMVVYVIGVLGAGLAVAVVRGWTVVAVSAVAGVLGWEAMSLDAGALTRRIAPPLIVALAVLGASRWLRSPVLVGATAFGAAALAAASGALWSGAGAGRRRPGWRSSGGRGGGGGSAGRAAPARRPLGGGGRRQPARGGHHRSDGGERAGAAGGLRAAVRGLQRRLRWRSLEWAAVAAAAETLAAVLNPAFLGHGWREGWATGLAVTGVSGAALWAASRSLGSHGVRRGLTEAVETAAIVSALTGVFIAVHAVATLGERRFDNLVQAALYVLALLLAGYGDLLTETAEDGRVARWRSRGLLLLGGALALVFGVGFSPWWGAVERVAGPPVLDSVLLAYLGPAVVAALAAARLYRGGERWLGRGAVLVALAGLWLWWLHAVRRAFDGPVLQSGGVGMHEAAVYALLALATPLLLGGLARVGSADALRKAELERASVAAGWVSLAASVGLIGLAWNPWWGPNGTAFVTTAGLLAMLSAYPAAAALSLAPARSLGVSGALRAAGQGAAVLHVFLALTLSIRAAYRGLDLRPAPGGAGLETWSYSAAWALLGVAVLTLGTRRGEAALRWCGLALVGLTVGKVLVFDVAALSGVTRAGSFLAVGAMLLVGALLLRRRGQEAV